MFFIFTMLLFSFFFSFVLILSFLFCFIRCIFIPLCCSSLTLFSTFFHFLILYFSSHSPHNVHCFIKTFSSCSHLLPLCNFPYARAFFLLFFMIYSYFARFIFYLRSFHSCRSKNLLPCVTSFPCFL